MLENSTFCTPYGQRPTGAFWDDLAGALRARFKQLCGAVRSRPKCCENWSSDTFYGTCYAACTRNLAQNVPGLGPFADVDPPPAQDEATHENFAAFTSLIRARPPRCNRYKNARFSVPKFRERERLGRRLCMHVICTRNKDNLLNMPEAGRAPLYTRKCLATEVLRSDVHVVGSGCTLAHAAGRGRARRADLHVPSATTL